LELSLLLRAAESFSILDQSGFAFNQFHGQKDENACLHVYMVSKWHRYSLRHVGFGGLTPKQSTKPSKLNYEFF